MAPQADEPRDEDQDANDDPTNRRLPPRWGAIKISSRDLFAVLMLGVLLAFILLTRQQCGQSAGNLIRAFEAPDAGGSPRAVPMDASREMPEEWKQRGP